MISRSAKNLQIILNKLESFCENADLSVNLDKTKIMIFNNCGKSLNNYLFRYGVDELKTVKSYKYLGLMMSPFGNFNLARQELKKVALKALYKLQKEMGNHFRENIKLTMKLFDALISPILFYVSEVWGIDCKGKLEKDPAELVQNKFLKWLLGDNKHCNNNACRAETGRFPMKTAAQCRNFKFWLTLTKNEYLQHIQQVVQGTPPSITGIAAAVSDPPSITIGTHFFHIDGGWCSTPPRFLDFSKIVVF